MIATHLLGHGIWDASARVLAPYGWHSRERAEGFSATITVQSGTPDGSYSFTSYSPRLLLTRPPCTEQANIRGLTKDFP